MKNLHSINVSHETYKKVTEIAFILNTSIRQAAEKMIGIGFNDDEFSSDIERKIEELNKKYGNKIRNPKKDEPAI